jgi:hypothetical protein
MLRPYSKKPLASAPSARPMARRRGGRWRGGRWRGDDGLGVLLGAAGEQSEEGEGEGLRWIATGKTILNIQGKPVLQYWTLKPKKATK